VLRIVPCVPRIDAEMSLRKLANLLLSVLAIETSRPATNANSRERVNGRRVLS
jgi:hypothetical protein